MNKKKTLLESEFDGRFSNSQVLEYKFGGKPVGRKDRAIIATLSAHGISGKSCLDIGPGTGRWLTFLRGQGAGSLYGVDISNVALDRVASLCTGIQKVDMETDALQFSDDSFDVIISIEVLEHLRDPSNYLSEIIRVAKNESLVVMSLPNIASFGSRIRLLVGAMPEAIASDPTHVRFYRKKDIARLFTSYGQSVRFIPTSISLNPFNAKSKIKFPSFSAISFLDDSLVFCFKVNK